MKTPPYGVTRRSMEQRNSNANDLESGLQVSDVEVFVDSSSPRSPSRRPLLQENTIDQDENGTEMQLQNGSLSGNTYSIISPTHTMNESVNDNDNSNTVDETRNPTNPNENSNYFMNIIDFQNIMVPRTTRFQEGRERLRQFQSSMRRINRVKFWKQGNFATILYFTPLTIALATVLMVDWDNDCDKHLREWALIEVCIQTLLIITNMVVISKLPPSHIQRDLQQRRLQSLASYYRTNRTLNFAWAIWFIVGAVWTFQSAGSDQCRKSAPFLYRMCFSLIVIQLVLLGMVMILCLCSLMLIGLRVFLYPPEEVQRNSKGATEKLIQALPSKQFQEGLISKEDASCAICLSDYESGELIRFLPCKHHFHATCVDQWLPSNKACPFCKREIDTLMRV